MGSFAYTCAISELPIEAGDPVLLLPMVPSGKGLNGGSSSQYEIAIAPIRGIYNDYGWIEDPKIEKIHEASAKMLGVESRDLTEDRGFDQKLREAVARAWHGKPLTFAMARVDAWDAMWSLPVSMGYESPKSIAELIEPAAKEGAKRLAAMKDWIQKWEAENVDAFNDMEADRREDFKHQMLRMEMRGPLMKGLGSESAFKSMFGHDLGGSRGDRRQKALFETMVHMGASQEEFEAALRGEAQLKGVEMAMFMLRKVWMPRDSCGPQGGELALHAIWAQKLTELAEKEIDWVDGYYEGLDQARSLKEARELSQHAKAGKKARGSKTGL